MRTLAAACVGAGVAWGALSYVTLSIGVLADGYGLSLSQAALVATFELAAMAAAAMSGGRVLQLLSVRHLALYGAIVAAAGNLATAVVTGILPVILARIVAGIGLGWLSAGLNTAISQTSDPERLFIRANFGCIALAAAFFVVMPLIYGHAGYPSYFIAYGLLCAACALLMGWLPEGSHRNPAPHAAARALGGVAIGYALAVSLVWLCYSAIWSLVERLGRDIGMTEQTVGQVLGIGTLSGLLGAGAAAWFAGRIRQPWPLIATTLASGLFYLPLTFLRSPLVYGWDIILWGVVFCPIMAYAYAVGTEIDSSGGLGRLLAGGTAITTALGPILGARLFSLCGYRGVGLVTFLGTAAACIAIALLLPRRAGIPAVTPQHPQGSR